MFLDALLLLSDAQAVTADAYSTNTIDLGGSSPARGIGAGEPMAVVVTVDVAADATTGDETYSFLLVQSANADLSAHDTLSTITVAAANLTAGQKVVIPVPPGSVTKRYVGVRYDVGGTTPSITCTAFLQPMSMIENRRDYADAITIS
jgi:hypothetical protein